MGSGIVGILVAGKASCSQIVFSSRVVGFLRQGNLKDFEAGEILDRGGSYG